MKYALTEGAKREGGGGVNLGHSLSPPSHFMLATGLQSVSVELGFWIPIASGVADSLSCIPDAKARDSGFHMQIFSGFRILQAETSRIGVIWIESTHTGCGMQKATIGSG